jgi:hypothetical protein
MITAKFMEDYYRVLLIRSPRVIDRAKEKKPPIEALGLLIGMYLLHAITS